MVQAHPPSQTAGHHDVATSQGRPPLHRFDLQNQILEADRVVTTHRALELEREDQVQIAARASDKGRAALCCRNPKTAIELVNVVFA
jgi:hypothetical protein